MSPLFLKAMPYIFLHEGSYNNNVKDSGGATNFGVSLVFLKSIRDDVNHDGQVNWLDIRALTQVNAEQIYWDNFWKPIYDSLPSEVGIKLFDFAVNAGNQHAHIILQKSLNDLGSKLAVDGMIGQATVAECSKYVPAQLLSRYVANQTAYYVAVVNNNPQDKIFLEGWENRAKWLPS